MDTFQDQSREGTDEAAALVPAVAEAMVQLLAEDEVYRHTHTEREREGRKQYTRGGLSTKLDAGQRRAAKGEEGHPAEREHALTAGGRQRRVAGRGGRARARTRRQARLGGAM
jgi:hypothetical protein